MSTTPHDVTYDVAIIGYGPVGATAANLLGARGLKVLVVERDTDVYARARAISLDEEILRAWQRIGLDSALEADMIGGQEITFVDERGRTFWRFTPQSRGHGHPPQMFIYQPAVDATLRSGVERHPDVEVRLGVECVGHSQGMAEDADAVTLSLRPTSGADSAGDCAGEGAADGDAPSTVRARWVIAADGGSSPTRSRLGIPFAGRTYEERWVVIDTRVLEPWEGVDRLKFHSDPRRPAVDCPTPLSHHRWEFPVLPGDDEDALTSPEGVRELLRAQGVEPHRVEVLRSVVYSHHVRFAARWRAGRILLAGDAAHVMPPWIGQGMSSGVRDVVNLCWKLDAVVRGVLPDSVLDSYQLERQAHVRELTRRAVRTGRVITERHPVLRRLRGPVFGLLGAHDGVARRFSALSWVPHARFSRGFVEGRSDVAVARGLSRLRRRATGRQVPQPWVIEPDGQRLLLDDVLAQDWAVLTVATSDVPGVEVPGAEAWLAAGVPLLRVVPAGTAPAPSTLVDVDGVLGPWLRRHHATTVVVRPDGFVHSARDGRTALPVPPFQHPG